MNTLDFKPLCMHKDKNVRKENKNNHVHVVVYIVLLIHGHCNKLKSDKFYVYNVK